MISMQRKRKRMRKRKEHARQLGWTKKIPETSTIMETMHARESTNNVARVLEILCLSSQI